MKAYYPILAVLALFGADPALNAQASCPQITGMGVLQHPSNPCDNRVRFTFVNPNNGQKKIRLEVRTNNVLVINECIEASGNVGQTQSFTSSNFTQCTLLGIEVRITPFNGNNCNSNGCTPFIRVLGAAALPVELVTFTATRIPRAVSMEWSTASENGSKGFAVERQTGGNWHQIGYVSSQAPGGNSGVTLSYRFIDNDPSQGATRYRLRQEDLNGAVSYSEVRSVAGSGQTALVYLFPNPSVNGDLTVVLGSSMIRNLLITDLSGRIVRQWHNHIGSRLSITGIPNGQYALRVSTPEGGFTSLPFVVAGR